MKPGDDWAIFLNGSYGVGKSATLEHIGDLLAAAHEPFSLIDIDWFHRSWPPADFDRENTLIEAENLAAVWANYRTAGPRRLVISGVIATHQDLERYSGALGLRIRPIRLLARPETAEARLRGRYSRAQPSVLEWHLQRHSSLGERLDRADIDEATVDTDSREPGEVAAAVLRHFRLSRTSLHDR